MFKRLKKWLKGKIEELIEIDNYISGKEFYEYRIEQQDQIISMLENMVKYKEEIELLNKELDLFKSMCDVGVDIHMKTNSWAIVCLEGKAEYVNFVRLDSRDARDVKQFIKRFDKANIWIDAPYGMLEYFKW